MAKFPVLFKGSSAPNSIAPGGISVLLAPGDYENVQLLNSQGNVLESLQRNTIPHIPEPGDQGGEFGTKYYSKRPGMTLGNDIFLKVRQNGIDRYTKIPFGGGTFRGDVAEGKGLSFEDAVALPQTGSSPGMGGTGGGFMMGAPGQYAPGQFGFGYFPAYLGDQYPDPIMGKWNNVNGAPYNFIDPTEFARNYGSFSREELQKNFDLSRDLALDTLDTELESLQKFVPAASALKRNEVSLDNQFNQAQRTQQIDSALPGVRGDLESQAERARAYAEGRLPSSIEDRAFEVGVRSAAADNASAAGFGVRSGAAMKASNLMSAAERLKISQYGDQLLTNNIGNKANLFLAPTEYSNAGQQVNVNPTVSPAQLMQSTFGQVNSNTMISPGQALSTAVQQEQFQTNTANQVRQFNATGQANMSQFNANVRNQFAQNLFGYQVGYAGAVAGAAQLNANTEMQLGLMNQYQSIFQQNQADAQSAAQTGAISGAIGTALANVGNILNAFGLGGSGSQNNTTSGGNVIQSDPNLDTQLTGSNPPDFSYDLGSSSTTPGTELPEFSSSYNENPLSFSGLSDIQSFSSDSGFSGNLKSLTTSPQQLEASAASTLQTAGLSMVPTAGTQPVGVNTSGKPVYANSALLKSADSQMGGQMTNGIHQALAPLGVFQGADKASIDRVSSVASDASFAATLGSYAETGQHKQFVNAVMSKFQQPTVEALSKDASNQSGLNAAFSAYQLSQNWGQMSPAQKSMGLANIGLQTYKFANGENLATKPLVIDPTIPGGKLTVGQGLSLFQAGYNTYTLVDKWDQLSPLSKIAMGTGDAAQIANISKSFGLLGAGTEGAEVAGVTARGLAQAGWSPAPQFGPGAIVGGANAQVPQGFVGIPSSNGQVVASPAGTAQATQGSVSAQAGSLFPTAAGAASVALGAYQVYKNWGAGGAKGALAGGLGGSAMAAGLYGMSSVAGGLGPAALANPYLLGGVIAFSLLGGMAKTGKSGDQSARDGARSVLQRVGVADENYQVTLADGSRADIGIDGHGGQHEVRDRSKLTKEHSGLDKLNAWDIDYTNDLDYVAGMGGISLSRLFAGGKGTNVDQIGNQLGNAAIGNIGYGKDMTPENYDKMTANLRAIASQSGIKSKADAYQLANQARHEGRINDSDLVSMHQVFNMMYDQGSYQSAQTLMQGRFRGLEVAGQYAGKEPVVVAKTPPVTSPAPGAESKNLRLLTSSKEDMRRRNAARYQIPQTMSQGAAA